MTAELAVFWQHDVTVARYLGAGAYGDTYDTDAVVTGLVDDSSRLVIGPDGEQITSSARVFLPAATAAVPLGSHVTLPAAFGGRTSRVVAVSVHDSGTLGLPDHLEIALL